MGERNVEDAAETPPGEFPISPLLERSRIDADGHSDLEVGVSVSGSDPIDENELDVFLRRSRIDPGEQIELGLFVSGADEIDETELSVFHDHGDVVDLENPGTVRRKASAGSNASPTDSTERVTVTEVNAPGMGAGGDRAADTDDGRDGDRAVGTGDGRIGDRAVGTGDGRDGDRAVGTDDGRDGDTTAGTEYVQPATFRDGASDYALERKPLGGTGSGGPGYILEINTRATAPPGTYPLPIVFTYRSADGIKQVKKVRTVRVNTRRERWQPWLTRIAIGVVALVTFGLGVLFLVAPSILL